MKNIGASNTNLHLSIPKETEIEILSRLPVKSLMRFKIVCKLWKSTIENDPSFIALHLAHSNTQPSLSRILISFTQITNQYIYSASLDGGPAIHHLTLPGCGNNSMFYHNNNKCCAVSESLNGLVCYNNTIDVHICNPSTRRVKILPRIQKNRCGYAYDTSFSFGFNPSTKEYKVLHIRESWSGQSPTVQIFTLQTDSRTGEVFTLDTDSWRSMTDVPAFPYPFRTRGLCVNGAIHWMGKYDHDEQGRYIQGKVVLVAFDVGSEEFRFIRLPKGISSYSDLTKVRGCLALLHYRNQGLIEMWILEDYKNLLWIHNQSIESPYYNSMVKNPISYGNVYNGEMLLTPNVLSREDYIMILYHLKNRSVRLIRVSGLPDWIFPHKEKFIDFSIGNHVESLLPIVTKRLLRFGDFDVYVNI